MALTGTRIRNVKPKPKPYKLSDGGGLYLLVMPDGARYWRMDYRFAGKRRTLALGIYPLVSLSEHAHAVKRHGYVSLRTSIPASQEGEEAGCKGCLRQHLRGDCARVAR